MLLMFQTDVVSRGCLDGAPLESGTALGPASSLSSLVTASLLMPAPEALTASKLISIAAGSRNPLQLEPVGGLESSNLNEGWWPGKSVFPLGAREC